MASFEKRGEYQWRAKVRRQGQPELSKTFDTRKDAEAWANEVERKIKRGEIDDLDPATQKITIAIAVSSYITEIAPGLARGGSGTTKVHLKRIDETFGKFFVSALRPPAINQWVRSLKDEGLSPQTVIHHLNTLSALIGHAQTFLGVHLPAGNPVRQVKRPTPSPARDRILREGEFELLMRAANSSENGGVRGKMLEPIIKLALETSMRQGELLAMEWSWLDKKNRVINIPADHTKNGESRSVALSSQAMSIFGSLQETSTRVFSNWKDAQSFQKPWQRLVKTARAMYLEDCKSTGTKPTPLMLENLRFHDLRHHATTQLFSKGLNPFEVASMTGHKSMQMLKRYTHVDAKNLAIKLG
ncbi:XerC Integrase [Comamonadaceae bacterium]